MITDINMDFGIINFIFGLIAIIIYVSVIAFIIAVPILLYKINKRLKQIEYNTRTK